jgi:DNA replicative helicase MCM subunit Mcm2 (Cdc46/Mcm family)
VHTLVIGAPAVGKKLLTAAAQSLNPVFYEAHPSKVTVAGVCSTASYKDGVWRSHPGYLPLAHRGVFAIQDFHGVKAGHRSQLLDVFNGLMEEGRVIDATAGKETHAALTSLHLDLNKRTDLFPDSTLQGATLMARRLNDLQMPMTILSRFDFIIDIPWDAQRQIDIALAMYDQPIHDMGPTATDHSAARGVRDLKVLVALLRSDHPTVHFPSEIRHMMLQRHKDFLDKNQAQLEEHPWISDFQTRLVQTRWPGRLSIVWLSPSIGKRLTSSLVW